jgi:hypothetical protein
MAKAIEEVLSSTWHQMFQWFTHKNLVPRLGSLNLNDSKLKSLSQNVQQVLTSVSLRLNSRKPAHHAYGVDATQVAKQLVQDSSQVMHGS